MIASYETRPMARPSPKPYYSFTIDPTTLQTHSHNHTHATHSLPTTPIASCSSSSKTRPKHPHPLVKKPSCSTRDKRQDVQSNLEAKVEKSKGFHAFFVPLGRSLPAAPPSSPVLGASTHPHGHGQTGGVGEVVGKDYFEDWVEDVGGSGKSIGRGEAMDLD